MLPKHSVCPRHEAPAEVVGDQRMLITVYRVSGSNKLTLVKFITGEGRIQVPNAPRILVHVRYGEREVATLYE